MRDLPPPRIPDAVPMPGGDSRDWVQHPGPRLEPRVTALPCRVSKVALDLPAGVTLLDALSRAVEEAGADGASVVLDGLTLSQADWVMPDGPADDSHAAWYSETHVSQGIRLDRATASVGCKDGAWFLHTHALWSEGETPRMGHLLNDRCLIGAAHRVEAHLIHGARLEVAPDAETGFPLFAPHALTPVEAANAALITIRPHEDLHAALSEVCRTAGLARAEVIGLGSLIGAGFDDTAPMTSPLSEVLLLPGCRVEADGTAHLPLACVDPWGVIHRGQLKAGQGPVLVTFEVLAVAL